MASKDILAKLAAGKKLSEREVQLAVDRSITLPEEYNAQISEYQHQGVGGEPPTPVVSSAQFPTAQSVSGPVVILDEASLMSLKKGTLAEIADAAGIEATGTKSEMVSALLGGMPVAEGAGGE